MTSDRIERIIPYVIKVSAIFYGVLTLFIGILLYDIVEDHYKTKKKYLKFKRERMYKDMEVKKL